MVECMVKFLYSTFYILCFKVKFKRVLPQNTIIMQDGSRSFSTSSSSDHAHDDIDNGLDDENNMIGDVEETQLDDQTQTRLDSAVDRLLSGFNWTLAPLANK